MKNTAASMENKVYGNLMAACKKRQRTRLLLSAAVMVLGFILCSTGIGGIAGLAAMLYLMMEGAKTCGMKLMRNKSLKMLKNSGKLKEAMESLANGKTQQLDGLTFAWSHDYFCTGYGAIYETQQIVWMFPFTQTIRYFFIPVVRNHWCKMLMTDGTERIAFYGKAKDKEAFEKLLRGLRMENPQLLIGHTQENMDRYQLRQALSKAQ